MDSGKVVASIPVAGDTDDIFYDEGRKRIYVAGGEGMVPRADRDTLAHGLAGVASGYFYLGRTSKVAVPFMPDNSLCREVGRPMTRTE